MQLLVQQFLETHSLKELQVQHGVYASFSKSGHKFSLNYDMIEAKENDPLAQECRGLILSPIYGHSLLDQSIEINKKKSYDHLIPGKTSIIAFPFKRFFNLGQGDCAVNWNDPKLTIMEKLDGSLCIIYFDPFTDRWCVATRATPEADVPLDNGLFTFRTLFEKAFQETTGKLFEEVCESFDKSYTYCFELTTPYNSIVVPQFKNSITLLGIRDLDTHQEFDLYHNFQIDPTIPIVKTHPYSSMEDIVNWVHSLNSDKIEHEGVVVKDSNFNRIKIKNAAYCAANKLRDTLCSPRNIMELILMEKDDDVSAFIPEDIAKNVVKIKAGISQSIKDHDLTYENLIKEYQPIDKKTFALAVQKVKPGIWSAPLYSRYANKSKNMKDFIQQNQRDGTWGASFLDKMLEIAKS